MPDLIQSRLNRAISKLGHVRYFAESRNQFRILRLRSAPLQVDAVAVTVSVSPSSSWRLRPTRAAAVREPLKLGLAALATDDGRMYPAATAYSVPAPDGHTQGGSDLEVADRNSL